VVESLVEDPDFDFELLLSLLLLGEAALLPEDDGDASDEEPAAEPGAVAAGEDCAPDVLSGVACVPYGDLWSDCVPLSGLDDGAVAPLGDCGVVDDGDEVCAERVRTRAAWQAPARRILGISFIGRAPHSLRGEHADGS
jgi:hypothetical protein